MGNCCSNTQKRPAPANHTRTPKLPSLQAQESTPRTPANKIPRKANDVRRESRYTTISTDDITDVGKATEFAHGQLLALLDLIRHSGKQTRTFARWLPFQEKYEEHLFSDVLRKLEYQEELEIMSEDESVTSNSPVPETLDDVGEIAPLPEAQLQDILKNLRKRILPPTAQAKALITKVTEHFRKLESVVNINVPDEGKIVIVGDLHGQFPDLERILQGERLPSNTTHYLFNGDFVDRGPEQCEVLLFLYCLKLLYPSSVWMNRGNHEEHRVNKAQGKAGFLNACLDAYDDSVYRLAQASFKALPLAHVINGKICVVHGGLGGDSGVTLREMRSIDRERDCPISKKKGRELPPSRTDRIFQALLWSDPREIKDRTAPSSRGAGVQFSSEVTAEFLATNNLSMLIRSHEVVSQGHRDLHGGKCRTIFSASRYCGQDDNMGAYMVLYPGLKDGIVEYFARPDQRNLHNVSRTQSSLEEIPRTAAMRLLGEIIFSKKAQLLAQFQAHDPEQKGQVTKAVWVVVMRACVNSNLPWYSLCRHLVRFEDNGKIAYISFLERFQNRTAVRWMNSWAKSMMKYGQVHLQNCAQEMKKLIRKMEHKKEAKLSYHEVAQALTKTMPALNQTEIYYLLASMDTNRDGFLDISEWVAATSEYKGDPLPGILDLWDLKRSNYRVYHGLLNEMEFKAGTTVPQALFVSHCMLACDSENNTKPLWETTARTIAKTGKGAKVDLKLVKKMVEELEEDQRRASVLLTIIDAITRARVRLEDVFRVLDTDEDGYLSKEEFAKGLTQYGLADMDESMSMINPNLVTKADAYQLWEHIDVNKDANVSLEEFESALRVYDTWEEMSSSLMRIPSRREVRLGT